MGSSFFEEVSLSIPAKPFGLKRMLLRASTYCLWSLIEDGPASKVILRIPFFIIDPNMYTDGHMPTVLMGSAV